jgi:hypothetical protein
MPFEGTNYFNEAINLNLSPLGHLGKRIIWRDYSLGASGDFNRVVQKSQFLNNFPEKNRKMAGKNYIFIPWQAFPFIHRLLSLMCVIKNLNRYWTAAILLRW